MHVVAHSQGGATSALNAVAALTVLPLAGVHLLLVLVPVAWTAATAVAQWVYWQRRFRDDADVPGMSLLDGVDWLDLWAPFDLVPNGRPVATDGAYRAVLVPGSMSVLRDHVTYDHVTYDHDLAETVPRMLAHASSALPHVPELLLRPGVLAPGGAALGAMRGLRARRSLHDAAGRGNNWMPWERRDWWSVGMRSATWLGAVALVAVPSVSRLDAWGRWAWGLAPVEGATGAVEAGSPGPRRSSTGGAPCAAATRLAR